MKKITILYSGGLDSLIMKRLVEVNFPDAEVRCLWFDIGQEYSEKEEAALPDFVEKRKVDWLSDKEKLISKEDSKSGSIIIPGRNAVLATLAASITLPDEIWMGALLGETHKGSTDKNYTFLNHINEMLNYVHSPYKDGIYVRFPLADMGFGKFEAVEWGLNNGITPETMLKTSSCLSGEHGNCGKCVVCLRRWGIFDQFDFGEEYNIHPLKHKPNIEIIKEMLKGEIGQPCHYDLYRRREIMPTIYRELDVLPPISQLQVDFIINHLEEICNDSFI